MKKFLLAVFTFLTASVSSQVLTQSEIAIFRITTTTPILDEPKTLANLEIFWEPGNAINTLTQPAHRNIKIGIEERGSSSSSFPKKSYGFETWDVNGNVIIDSLLNFPKESDWVLSANYTDKSLFNNALSYKLSRDMGMYAPRTQFVEVIINGNYKGVYVFMEKIKRDKNRVDISKLVYGDTTGANLTGGYIVKIDKNTGSASTAGWDSQVNLYDAPPGQTVTYQYAYPKYPDMHQKQRDYIKNYVDTFENELNTGVLNTYDVGWRKYADEESFIKYFLLNEYSKNVDGYRLSTYLYKKKSTSGGKLSVGPPWDYDLGWGNSNYCDGSVVEGWGYNFNMACNDTYMVPFWWKKLMTEDTLFQKKVACRWKEYRTTVLDTTTLFNYIDQQVLVFQNCVNRNFNRWPILNTYVWPNPAPQPANYAGEILELKAWIRNRYNWLDANLLSNNCTFAGIGEIEQENEIFVVYPNPVQDKLYINLYTNQNAKISLFDATGRRIELIQNQNDTQQSFDTSTLPSGSYLIQVEQNNTQQTKRFIKL
jgi:hypothetical protein